MTSSTKLLTALLLMCTWSMHAQEARSFSLDEAISHALANNYELKQKQLDVDIANAQVKETTAAGLPQVTGEAALNYYIDVPTQLAEPFDFDLGDGFNQWIGEVGGTTGVGLPQQDAVDPDALQSFQFGLPWGANAGITISQLVFDGSYFVGLKAARAYKENSELGVRKSEIEIKNGVTQTYFSVVAMDQTLTSLKDDLVTISKNAEDTKALYEAGLAEKQDADQVRLIRSNLEYQIQATERQRTQMMRLLKFQMGVPVGDEVSLTSSMEELVSATEEASGVLEQNVNFQNHIDYQMIEKGMELQELSLSSERTKNYPSLNAFFTHSQNGFARDFGELLDAPYKAYWPTTLAGLQLNVPIFSSGMRYQRTKIAKLELQKLESQKTQVEQNLTLQAESSRDSYRSALESYQLRKEDLELAESIRENTREKFNAGLASSQDLSSVESQYLQTLRNYINTTLELLNAKLALDKALGNI